MPDLEHAPTVLVVEGRPELAQLMAAALETAGFRATVAGLANEARRRIADDPPDALITELLLPDAFGFEVARTMREARPKAFVMAISDGFDDDPAVTEALHKGLFDAFTRKPFRIGRVVADMQSQMGLPSADREEGEKRRADDPVRDLAGRCLESSGGDSFFDRPEGGLIAAALEAAEAEATGDAELVGAASGTAGSDVLHRGDLSERSVPRLMNAFYLGGQSGELMLRQGRVMKMIYFRHGIPVFAASNLREDRFDVRLLKTSEVAVDVVRDAVSEADRTGKRIDRVLLERGALSPGRHKALVAEQVKSILFGLFPWQSGVWEITFDDRAEEEPVRLEIHPADLIMEGAFNLPLETLVELLPRDVCLAPSPSPPYELYQLSLNGEQATVVSRLDGTRSVAEVSDEGWLSEQETHALLYGLLCLEVVEDASLLLL